jgi:hypothetical protein
MSASSSLAASSAAGLVGRSGTIVSIALAERAKTPQVRASFSIWAISVGSVLFRKASMSLSIFARRWPCSVPLQSLTSSLLPAMT